ncbi:MAG: dTDP-4-dehydrorhamnose 3,5-epimerase [Ignavibacteria bacterium]|nr:MAG: dTDP-4-dehydrorhamnose 3,5-epimerase [Ignavibacteria bacterium]
MTFTPTSLPGILLITPKVFGDERGFFMESYRRELFEEAGIPPLVQDNHSRSVRDTLRGLHYQHPYGQGKLIRVTSGVVFDVLVDVRRASPTFGKWEGHELSESNKRQLWVPPGFAHGFCVLSESADFLYKCSEYYHPETEHTLLWNDEAVGVEWPVRDPILSEKDMKGKRLNELSVLPE